MAARDRCARAPSIRRPRNAPATDSKRRWPPARRSLSKRESAHRRRRGCGPGARGGSLLQRRAWQRADRVGRDRARCGDHGRAHPPRRGGRRAADDARADQPGAAGDGARPARVPVRATAPTTSRARPGSSRSTTIGSRLPSGGASSISCLAKAGSTMRSNTAPSARSLSTLTAMSRSPTSTGGLTAKRWGRVGDSPLIGAGTYADDRAAAVSATGSGEYFIRAAAAHELAARVRIGGEPLQQALDGVLADIAALGGKGGLIAVSPVGRSGVGLHDARDVPRHGRFGRPFRRDLFRRGRTVGQALAQPFGFGRDCRRARRPGTRRPPPESRGWE